MAEVGLHAMRQDRPMSQRFFWLWIVLAFLLGLLPGLGLFAYKYVTANARAEALITQVQTKADKVAAQDKQIAKLESEVASAQAAAAPVPDPSPSNAATGTPAIPDVKAGQIEFVTRTAAPDPVAPGGALKLSTVVAGSATEVYMQIKSADGQVSKIYRLNKGAADGKATTWARSDATAPKTAGTYSLFVWGFVGKAKTVMPGIGRLTVK
jgi:hypothetical protein